MATIPKDAHWYLADLVLEMRVEDDPRNVVHINTHLIEASSPEQAYEKAIALGGSSQVEYPNSDNKKVRVVFRGLRQLSVVYDELEDGAELGFANHEDVPESSLRQWILSKDNLTVFASDHRAPSGVNYMPATAMGRLITEDVEPIKLNETDRTNDQKIH